MIVLPLGNPSRKSLDHARRACHHFEQPPAFQLRKRPRRHDPHCVALPRFAVFVMRVIFLRRANHAHIQRMLRGAHHLHHDGLVHLGAGHHADQFLPAHALFFVRSRWPLGSCRGRSRCFLVRHFFFLSSCSRSKVFTRASSLRASRMRFTPSVCPVVN